MDQLMGRAAAYSFNFNRRPAAAKPPEKRKVEYTMFENLKKAVERSEKEQAETAGKTEGEKTA